MAKPQQRIYVWVKFKLEILSTASASPRVGSEVLAGVVPDAAAEKLLAQPWVREILPVGSKGVLYEAGQLASTVQRKFSPAAVAGLDLYKSAGPATSLLVATEGERLAELREIADVAVFPVGTIQ